MPILYNGAEHSDKLQHIRMITHFVIVGEATTLLKTIEKLRNGERVFIVCLGDSITEQNYHLYSHLNYVGRLSEQLLETFGRNHLLLNAGVSGDTSWGIVDRLDRDALRFQPDLLTLMIGINDARHGLEGLEGFRSNLKEIITRTANAGSEILLLSQNIISFEQQTNVESRSSYPEYTRVIREVAKEMQVPLCDLNQAWLDEITANPNNHWRLLDDDLHPNEHGHAFFANKLFEYLGIS